MPNLDLGFVRLPSGLRLRYRCAGDEGATVLLLHGWPETGYAWRRVLPTLAASGYVAIAPDLRGCGDSDKPIGGYEAGARMEDARALIEALGLAETSIFVAGHGEAGAAVASAFAAAHPAEVAALALLSAGPGLPAQAGWMREFHQTPDLPELLIAPQIEAYLRHFFRAWAHDPDMLSEADLGVYVQALEKPGALRASLAPFRVPATALPPAHAVPTLLLLGESDPRLDLSRLPEETSRLRVQTVPRGGYWLPEERPDPVAAALLTFFREQDAPLASSFQLLGSLVH